MRLLIYGAGGLGRGTYEILRQKNDGRWDEFLFIDGLVSDPDLCGIGCVLFQSGDPRINPADSEILIAVGEPESRFRLQKEVEAKGFRLATYIDRDAWVASDAKVEAGAVILSGAMLDVNVTIKKNAFIFHNASIGHDSVVGESTVVSANANLGGNVSLGIRSFVGLQAVIKQGITIGNDAIISMGAAVFQDVGDRQVLVGNPARVTKGKENHHVFN